MDPVIGKLYQAKQHIIEAAQELDECKSEIDESRYCGYQMLLCDLIDFLSKDIRRASDSGTPAAA